MYSDSRHNPIHDNAAYTAPNGTKYPATYPKDQIAGLHEVQETPRPQDASLIVTGFYIDDDFNQVWTIEEKTETQLANEQAIALSNLRLERNQRLTRCDWTQLADAPLTEAQKTAWETYRQTLRDLPQVTADASNPIWPEEPEI